MSCIGEYRMFRKIVAELQDLLEKEEDETNKEKLRQQIREAQQEADICWRLAKDD